MRVALLRRLEFFSRMFRRSAALGRLRGLIAKGLCPEEDVQGLYKELEARSTATLRGTTRHRAAHHVPQSRGKAPSGAGPKSNSRGNKEPTARDSAGDGDKFAPAAAGAAAGDQEPPATKGGVHVRGGAARRAHHRGMPRRGMRGTRRVA